MKNQNINCWIITEGMIGTENQCLGVADALGITANVKRVGLNQPWKTLSPWLGFEMACSFTPPLTPPWPDLLIAAGRKSIAASRYIKKQSEGKTFTVQLQDPKTSPRHFDLVAAPFHDQVSGKNVITTHGAPNRITVDKLLSAKQQFAPLFEDMPAPRIAVLIGGNSRTHKMTSNIMRGLIEQLKTLNGSLMITASRRTGEGNLQMLKDALGDHAYIWDGTGDNPYHGMLGWADHILVTADSVSMLSDAGTTGKPVHVIPLEGRSPRFDRLHQHLSDIGVTKPLKSNKNGNLTAWSYEPLQDGQVIANAIRQAMQKRYG